MSQDELPTVSILVITKDRRDELANLLSSLKKVDYPKELMEIVVVEEADSPKEIEDVKYIWIPRENKGFGYARNLTVKNANNEIVIFTDDDCIVTENWVREIIKPFPDERVLGVAGGVRIKGGGITGKCEEMLGFPGGGLKRIIESKGKIQKTNLLSTCNCAYRRSVFLSRETLSSNFVREISRLTFSSQHRE